MIRTIETTVEAMSLNDIDFGWKIVGRRRFARSQVGDDRGGMWRYTLPADELRTFRDMAFRERVGTTPHISICTGRNETEDVLYARLYPVRLRVE